MTIATSAMRGAARAMPTRATATLMTRRSRSREVCTWSSHSGVSLFPSRLAYGQARGRTRWDHVSNSSVTTWRVRKGSRAGRERLSMWLTRTGRPARMSGSGTRPPRARADMIARAGRAPGVRGRGRAARRAARSPSLRVRGDPVLDGGDGPRADGAHVLTGTPLRPPAPRRRAGELVGRELGRRRHHRERSVRSASRARAPTSSSRDASSSRGSTARSSPRRSTRGPSSSPGA